MRYAKNETRALWNLAVEDVQGADGRLEITVKNPDHERPTRKLIFNGDCPVFAGNTIIAYMPRVISPSKETGDISDPQSGETHSAEKSSPNENNEVVYIEILTEKGKVKRTDYSNTIYRKSQTHSLNVF